MIKRTVLLLAFAFAATVTQADPVPSWNGKDTCAHFLQECAGPQGKWCTNTAKHCPKLNSATTCQHYIDKCKSTTKPATWCKNMAKHCGVPGNKPTCGDFKEHCSGAVLSGKSWCGKLSKVCAPINYSITAPACKNYLLHCAADDSGPWCQRMKKKCGGIPPKMRSCDSFHASCKSKQGAWCHSMSKKCGGLYPGENTARAPKDWGKLHIHNWIAEGVADGQKKDWGIEYVQLPVLITMKMRC